MCKILRLFANTLTANEKYYLLNRDDLTQPIHVYLPEKQKTFSRMFFVFSKHRSNFEHFRNEDDPHKGCIFETTDS